MIPDPKLSEILAGKSIPFTVDGKVYRIRPPTTEEYDDAIMVQSMVYRRWMSQPEVQGLANQPPSTAHRQIFEELIQELEEQLEALPEDELGRRRVLSLRLRRLRQELHDRNLAEEVAVERATLARDRWLCARLLCDENGDPVFDTTSEEFAVAWEQLPMGVKDAARPVIWRVLAQVATTPFGSERPPESGSS